MRNIPKASVTMRGSSTVDREASPALARPAAAAAITATVIAARLILASAPSVGEASVMAFRGSLLAPIRLDGSTARRLEMRRSGRGSATIPNDPGPPERSSHRFGHTPGDLNARPVDGTGPGERGPAEQIGEQVQQRRQDQQRPVSGDERQVLQ